MKILLLCCLFDQIRDKDSIWLTKTPIHVELHPFSNKLLALELLSQVSEGSQTSVGLFLGLRMSGLQGMNSILVLFRDSMPYLNQTCSLPVFHLLIMQTRIWRPGQLDWIPGTRLTWVQACPVFSSHTQRLRHIESWHHPDKFCAQESAINQNMKNMKMEFSLQICNPYRMSPSTFHEGHKLSLYPGDTLSLCVAFHIVF